MESNHAIALRVCIALLAAGLLLPAHTYAVANPTITWQTPQNITADSDIVTTGTLVAACNFGGGGVSAATINGVTFAPFAVAENGTTAQGNTSVFVSAGVFDSNTEFGSSSAPFSGLSAGYQTLLSSGIGSTTASSTITITISGLTAGQAYAFEWWTNDAAYYFGKTLDTTATETNSATLSDNVSNAAGSAGQFVIGTFTALSTTSGGISFTDSAQGTSLINGFELRTVPEPATATLLAAGASIGALCGWCTLRRSRRARG